MLFVLARQKVQRRRCCLPIRSSDPVRCAEAIVDRAGRDIAIAMPIGVGKPVALVNALYRLAEADRRIRPAHLHGAEPGRPPYRTTLERRFVEPLLERCSTTIPTSTTSGRCAGGPAAQHRGHRILPAGRRLAFQCAACNEATRASTIRRSPRIWSASAPTFSASSSRRIRKRAARVSFSSNTDVTLDMLPYISDGGRPASRSHSRSRSMPTCRICRAPPRSRSRECDIVLEAERPHYDLFAPPKEPVSLADYAMALACGDA